MANRPGPHTPPVRLYDDRIRSWERHWPPYSAATDAHTAAWRERIASHHKKAGCKRGDSKGDEGGVCSSHANDKPGKSRGVCTSGKATATCAPCGAIVERQRKMPLSAVPRSTLYSLQRHRSESESERATMKVRQRIGAGLEPELRVMIREMQGLPPGLNGPT